MAGWPRYFALALVTLAVAFPAAAAPVQIATLLPFVEHALGRIDGPFVVVAAARRDLHTPTQKGVVDLGNPHSPSIEGLAQAEPDLVVADAALHAKLASQLGVGGAEVLLLETGSIDATLAGLDEVGRRAGAGPAMRRETDAVRERLVALALARPLPALAVFGAPGSFLVVTERTWLGDLLARLAFVNVGAADGGSERFPGLVALSDETLATLRPELVLLVAHGDPAAIQAAFTRRTADGGPWSGLRQSADHGVHVLDPALFAANPGLDLARAAESLVGLAAEAPPVGSAP
jgi:iron complex transport system substrate-binding protein